jgi:hypothetical protein
VGSRQSGEPGPQLLDPFINDPRGRERKYKNVKDSFDFGLRPGGLDILVQCPSFSGGSSVPQLAASDIVEALDFCGLGFHRNPWGACVPNGAPYGYVAPVVVAPAVVVAPRVVCPYGYYFYAAYNRCVPAP